ncbi:cyclic GMP-AMP synthase DncV-like nucleotidyltransferase [Chondromyces crocatus]|uniref:Cyclic GMP-AMP synthase n=1 Tax=Chondromyces crocatus TaxID=52 RepID=A0A0K1EGT8_CHOCO|nr:hypothetical protein [Chondromyces crocatus]AKT40071.1 uncharacterized protein CMC5_042240 [Chondromyces crocatus]
MANVQKQFESFDETIKLRRYHENATLAEKRERILRRLSEGIKEQRNQGVDIPSYRDFNQGSYDIGTGVKPIGGGEYDIDVGIEFDLPTSDHTPVEVKKWVLRAVEDHTTSVEMRKSCVTVTYVEGGEPKYHVDLAVYSKAQRNPDGKMYLARGKEHSAKEHQEWSPSAPEELTDKINNRFIGDDGRQFRQAIRALKRWKDHRFSREGQSAPRGIALAVAALHWFTPATTMAEGDPQRDTLGALILFLDALLRQFSFTEDSQGERYPRLVVRCPVEPFDDLCARMTAEQMRQFHGRVETLLEALREAQSDPDPHTACMTLQREFGDDFPVPPKDDTGSPRRKAITHSGASG